MALEKQSSIHPKITIGLPVYNGERFLRFTLDSILNQTYQDFELVISDNASTDHTKMICQEYAAHDSRIRYYRNLENAGAAENFNSLVGYARGEYFKWAAADDILSLDFLDKCLQVLEENPDIVLCFSKVDRINSSGEIEGTYDYPMRVNAPQPHIRFGDLILVNHFCIAVFGLMRLSVLQKTRLIGKYVGSDRVLLAEMGLRGRMCEIPEYLFHRRDHPQASGRLFDKYKRLVWLDPSLKNRINLLYWKVGFEYIRSILRSDLPEQEKILCLHQSIKWFIVRKGTLWNDIKTAIFQLFPFTRSIAQSVKKSTDEKFVSKVEK